MEAQARSAQLKTDRCYLKGVKVAQGEAWHRDIQQAEDGGEEAHVILPHQRHELSLHSSQVQAGLVCTRSSVQIGPEKLAQFMLMLAEYITGKEHYSLPQNQVKNACQVDDIWSVSEKGTYKCADHVF